MKKLATIINLGKTEFPNEKTGEVVDMCVVTYVTSHEEDEKSFGCDVRVAYIPGENYEKLKKYVIKPMHDLIYTSVATNNGEKYRLEKYADVELRKK